MAQNEATAKTTAHNPCAAAGASDSEIGPPEMACYSPIKGYRGRGGAVTFARPLDAPLVLAEVPCGQCIGCRLERSQQWAIRCLHEAQCHERNSFVTLTYDDQHLPDDHSLCLRDWQLFAKRLRAAVGSFRFYHCGEYGERTRRPHYHACLFGQDFHNDRQFYKTSQGNTYYTSPTLDKAWGLGYAIIGDVTYQSAAYVARYIIKKRTGAQAETHYKYQDEHGTVHDLKPEYTTMSRRPGIGSTWFERYADDVFPHDYVVVDGKKKRTPKYYDTQYELAGDDFALIRAQRRLRARRHLKNNTPERLCVREKVQNAKLALLKRNTE